MMQKHDYPGMGSATLHLALLDTQTILPGTQTHNGKAVRSFSMLKSSACEAGTNLQQPAMWGSKTLLKHYSFGLPPVAPASTPAVEGKRVTHETKPLTPPAVRHT